MADSKASGALALPRGRDGVRGHGNLYAPACPSRGVLDHVTSRWGVLVLVALMERTHRFSELRRRVGGVSEKMLSQTLQALEADGFVKREVFPEIPPRVEYSLTSLGEEVSARVEALADWIEGNLGRILAARGQPRSRGIKGP
ncbi:MAG TPA: helix-turn-helix domain-containing protein [Anaeromyxobacteraceae bacterium]|nr:helix-turn-helix domain-containing protein [Anaeromyxobacteraceae bacterium]